MVIIVKEKLYNAHWGNETGALKMKLSCGGHQDIKMDTFEVILFLKPLSRPLRTSFIPV